MWRSGDKVRVTEQLIDGLTVGQVWSERYDGQLKDAFDLQDKIMRNVVAISQTTVHLSAIQETGGAQHTARSDGLGVNDADLVFCSMTSHPTALIRQRPCWNALWRSIPKAWRRIWSCR